MPDPAIDALEASAYAAYSACLVGNPPPLVARMLHALTHPEPGHMVLEVSSFRQPEHGRLGTLLGVDGEVWTVRHLDGTVLRWSNSEWIRVFASRDELRDVSSPAPASLS